MDIHLLTNGYSFLFLSLLAALSLSIFFFLKPTTRKSSQPPLPPGPPRWPVVGNLFCLGRKPHKSLAQVAAIHGPLMSLRLGCRTTVVISSPSVAQEVMLHHDAVFAGRSVQDMTCSVIMRCRWHSCRRVLAGGSSEGSAPPKFFPTPGLMLKETSEWKK